MINLHNHALSNDSIGVPLVGLNSIGNDDPSVASYDTFSIVKFSVRSYDTNPNPTRRQYNTLTAVYDEFNERFFGGELPPCLITMQRYRGAYGYFAGGRWAARDNSDEVMDEIALNPSYFSGRSVEEILSTLLHEQVHLWQHHFGKPSRRAYHNRQWADKMLELGLIPTNTGLPGGKQTGQCVTHYIDLNGRFARVCQEMIEQGVTIPYVDRYVVKTGANSGATGEGDEDDTRQKKLASKTKYTCPECGLNAWAKPAASLMCVDCQVLMKLGVRAKESNG